MISSVWQFVKKQVVLVVAWILAIISTIIVRPSIKEIFSSIDFRSLAILFSLMAVVQCFALNGVFRKISVKIVSCVKKVWQLVLALVLMCFFFSMIITNDVALITFVPLSIMILNTARFSPPVYRSDHCSSRVAARFGLKRKGRNAANFRTGQVAARPAPSEAVAKARLMIITIVLETIAANLGSMLTPIGNPQNLYLYNLMQTNVFDFTKIMAPYSAISLALLVVSVFCIRLANFDVHLATLEGCDNPLNATSPKSADPATLESRGDPLNAISPKSADPAPLESAGDSLNTTTQKNCDQPNLAAVNLAETTDPKNDDQVSASAANQPDTTTPHIMHPRRKRLDVINKPKLLCFIILGIVALLAVFNVVPFYVSFVIVLVGTLLIERRALKNVDYMLLLTFIGFFIFTGNLSHSPKVSSFISSLASGNEVVCGIVLSQFISNVPCALLLSTFCQNLSALTVGVNLGGLGTLIASMASLISYKFYASQTCAKPGRYLLVFSALNILFLAILFGFYFFILS